MTDQRTRHVTAPIVGWPPPVPLTGTPHWPTVSEEYH